MEILTGVILDLSDSIRQNLGGKVDVKDGEWARSIYEVIDNFVKHDVSADNHIFAVGVGAKYGNGIFDLIKTIEPFQTSSNQKKQLNYDQILEDFFKLIEKSGASKIRKWADEDVIQNALSCEMAGLLLAALQNDRVFLNDFVSTCLPNACKNPSEMVKILPESVGSFLDFVQSKAVDKASEYSAFDMVKAKENDIRGVIGRLFKDVGHVFSAKQASGILHGFIDEAKPSSNRIEELMEVLTPYIYGDSQLDKALTKVSEIFSNPIYASHTKLLFVFSDGEPNSRSTKSPEELTLPHSVVKKLKELNVTIVSCLINKCNVEPQKLFCEEKPGWSNGAKFLFKLSSTLSSQLLPRTVLIKNGWDIETTTNETKLFLQINHPDNISNACKLAKNMVCCQDSLTDLLASVSLDMIINQSACSFSAKLQKGGTCYANAIAAVFYLSMKRIIGRTGNYPDFFKLREEMIKCFGEDGACVNEVLKQIAPKYRLQFESVDIKNAMKAIVAKRPVVAIFSLTKPEWDNFVAFYTKDRKGILTKSDIDKHSCVERFFTKKEGHAVVLTSFNSECLHFMNSWSDKWGDNGFFRVQNSKVLGFEFFDVYWTLDNLEKREIKAFESEGTKVAQELMKKLESLRNAEYECVLCKHESKVTEYERCNTLVKCPKCGKCFDFKMWNEAGNMLSLCLYLTSLYD